MKIFRFKLISLFLIVAVAEALNTIGQSVEDYKVYDAVVDRMFRDGITQFDMNAKVDKIVIRNRTRSGPDKENWAQVKIRMRSLTDETIQGYESVRKVEADLKAGFDIPLKYILISEKQLQKVVPHPNGPIEHWTEFYKLYPMSGGYNSFSRVGYDNSGRNALVYFVNWCGPLCGTGTYVLVEKGADAWVVKETAMMWIS